MRQIRSLNDIQNITHNIFTQIPPISLGQLLNDKQYKSKKLRQFIIKRYYKSIL
jgi:hypothetical protein